MAEFSAIGAAGVVLDVHTGEVIALASLPEFNPNAPGHGDDNGRFDRATLGVYELGSTFKPITIAMALNDGLIKSMDQKFDATAPIQIGRFTIHDDPDGHELRRWATVPEMFIHSSNIGTAQIADELGATRQRAYLDALGFLSPVAVELMERGHTLYPASNNWGEVATMTVGYGHGIAVTPLHLATAYAALVNGGIWRPATMLKVAPGQAVARAARVLSEATSRHDARAAAPGRHDGHRAQGERAGLPRRRQDRHRREAASAATTNKHVNVSTFAGAFPMDAPRYVVIAMLDSPHGTRETGGCSTAGLVAAPSRRADRRADRADARRRPRLDRDIDVSGMLGLVANAPDEGVSARRPLRRTALTGADAAPRSPASRSTTARSRRARCSARSRARRSMAKTSSPRRSPAGAVAVVARPEATVEGALHLSDAEPRRRFAAARRAVLRAVSRDDRRGHRHQRQDLDRRADAAAVAARRATTPPASARSASPPPTTRQRPG